jgi:hypothetical protein
VRVNPGSHRGAAGGGSDRLSEPVEVGVAPAVHGSPACCNGDGKPQGADLDERDHHARAPTPVGSEGSRGAPREPHPAAVSTTDAGGKKEHVMSKRIMIVGLLVLGVVAMLGTEATGQPRYCFGCLSGDQCQLTFGHSGVFTGGELNEGRVIFDCNNRFHGGKVLAAIVQCQNQGGTVAPGFPVQGNAEGTFEVAEVLTRSNISGNTAQKTNPIETVVTEFCTNPPEACADVCSPATCATDCYECYKEFFGLPEERIGCPNENWKYFAIDYNNHCVNFRVIVDGVEEVSITRRCTDPGNTSFVVCVEDQTNCPFLP